jgi:hypothetical protein
MNNLVVTATNPRAPRVGFQNRASAKYLPVIRNVALQPAKPLSYSMDTSGKAAGA